MCIRDSIFLDRDNNLWVSAWTAGVSYANTRARFFKTVRSVSYTHLVSTYRVDFYAHCFELVVLFSHIHQFSRTYESKVCLLYTSVMGGLYGNEFDFPEWNLVQDINAAQTVFSEWPTPVLSLIHI